MDYDVRSKLVKSSAVLMFLLVIPACTTTASREQMTARLLEEALVIDRENRNQPRSNATFCQVYDPVYWSSRDTAKTVEQVKGNNAAYKKLCSP